MNIIVRVMYKISIIIPVFNVEDTLIDSFNSILNQDFGFENLEVIFVDDCSTDNSANIIKDFSNKYDNVKSIFLDRNSGFAGRPRNIGILNSTADYIMFLDPDDKYLENACSLLYDNITKKDLDIVSGNFYFINPNEKIINQWNLLNLNGSEIQVNSVEEEPNLFSCNPAIWSKIYRKELILSNNIHFIEDLPAEDLVFNANCLLKANGIKFINIPIVNYKMRYDGNSKSKSVDRDRNALRDYIKAYKELYYLFVGTEYIKFSVSPMYFWTKQLILSDLPIQDKIDLLRFATPLYDKFKQTDLKLEYPFKPFFKKVYKRDYFGAILLSEKLSLEFEVENHFKLINEIKNGNIFIIVNLNEENVDDLTKNSLAIASLLDKNGYSVSVLNLGLLENSAEIIGDYLKNNFLNESVNVVTIFNYYSQKNNLNFSNNFNIRKNFKNEKLSNKEYLTEDNFIYLRFDCVSGELLLFNRFNDYHISFKDLKEFQNYFITELCLSSDEKPFLIDIDANNGCLEDVDYNLALRISFDLYSEDSNYLSIISENTDGNIEDNFKINIDEILEGNMDDLEFILKNVYKSYLLKKLKCHNTIFS